MNEDIAFQLAIEYRPVAIELEKAIHFDVTASDSDIPKPSLTGIGGTLFRNIEDVPNYIEELTKLKPADALAKIRRDLGTRQVSVKNIWLDDGEEFTGGIALIAEVAHEDSESTYRVKAIIEEGAPSDVIEAIGKKLKSTFRFSMNEIREQIMKHERLQTTNNEPEPQTSEEAIERTARLIIQRRGQPDFRNRLIEVYKRRCAISECDVIEALEAVHIIPYSETGTNHLSNGILLRADLHTLFDLGLIAIDSPTMTILLHEKLRGTTYEIFAGKTLYVPQREEDRPSKDALDTHRRTCGL